MEAVSRAHLPHYKALLLRRTFPELEETLIEEARSIYPHMGGVYNDSKHFWRFPSGARISFGYLNRRADIERYKGPQYQFIGIDELTTFDAWPVEFLFSRMRSKQGYPCVMRSASNPGGPGHSWVFKRFAPWLWEPGVMRYPGPRNENGKVPRPAPGQTLWLRRTKGGEEIVTSRDWHEPTCSVCAPGTPCTIHRPVSRAFFPARVSDNPFYAGTEYEQTLHNLPPIERARLLNGDWNIMPAAGMYFRRQWFTRLDAAPSDVIARVRYWDRAATEGGGDWTVGVRLAVRPGPFYVVEHVARAQLGPGGVEQLIVSTAKADPPGTIQALEQDPGQAGKVEIFTYSKLLAGFPFVGLPPQGDKLTRARPVSAQAHVGNVAYCPGAWNEPFFAVLEGFEGQGNEVDDDVDGLSGAFRVGLMEYERLTKRGGRATVHVIGFEEPGGEAER